MAQFLVIGLGGLMVWKGLGPPSLKDEEVHAFRTLLGLYRESGIAVEEGRFQTVVSRWLRVRKSCRAARPASQWAHIQSVASRGFLVEDAKSADQALLAFQHRVFQQHGEIAVELPSFVAAQEWRVWAMASLQSHQLPSLEARRSVEQRLAWIEAARNLVIGDVVDLRKTRCWDDLGDLSLLQVLRDRIMPRLKGVLSNWTAYELQLSLGEQLRSLADLLERHVQEGIRFLEVVLRQDELRIESQLPRGLEQCKSAADRLLLQLISHRDRQLAPSDARKRRRLEIEGPRGDRDIAAPSAPESSGHGSASSYGLQAQELDLLHRSVQKHHETLAKVVSLARAVRGLRSFAHLGGELFFVKVLSRSHVLEVLAYVSDALRTSRQEVTEIADGAQRGWEQLRRARARDSVWSSSGPFDNVRLAWSGKEALVLTASEGLPIIEDLCQRVQGFSCESVGDALNDAVRGYLEDWRGIRERLRLSIEEPSQLALEGAHAVSRL